MTDPRRTFGRMPDGSIAPPLLLAVATACLATPALFARTLMQFPGAPPGQVALRILGGFLGGLFALGVLYASVFYLALRGLGAEVRFSRVARAVAYMYAFSFLLAGHGLTMAVSTPDIRGVLDLSLDVVMISAWSISGFWFAADGVALSRPRAFAAVLVPSCLLLAMRIGADSGALHLIER